MFQYFLGRNALGFLPGMCGENYLNDKSVCTRYAGFFNDELILGSYTARILPVALSLIFFSTLKNKKFYIYYLSFISFIIIFLSSETTFLTAESISLLI